MLLKRKQPALQGAMTSRQRHRVTWGIHRVRLHSSIITSIVGDSMQRKPSPIVTHVCRQDSLSMLHKAAHNVSSKWKCRTDQTSKRTDLLRVLRQLCGSQSEISSIPQLLCLLLFNTPAHEALRLAVSTCEGHRPDDRPKWKRP